MPITGLPPLLVSSSDVILQQQAGDKEASVSFEKGRVVTARVLAVISGRETLLLINGKKMLAKTFVPLKPGQEITLQATGAGSHPVLRLVQETPGRIPEGVIHLIRSWAGSGPFSRLASVLAKAASGVGLPGAHPETAGLLRLRQLVHALALQSGEASPRFLRDLIQGSGLLWEKKLTSLRDLPTGASAISDLVEKDIKAMVMRLLSAEGSEPGEELEGLRSFLEGLEKLQLFNQFGDEDSGRYLLPLPVLTQGELKFGQLLIKMGGGRRKSEKESDAVVKVSFLLTLTRLGELRADFSILGRVLSVAFCVATEETRAFMAPHLSELVDRLQGHGYQVRDIECRVVGPEALAETVLFDMAVEGTAEGVLNVII